MSSFPGSGCHVLSSAFSLHPWPGAATAPRGAQMDFFHRNKLQAAKFFWSLLAFLGLWGIFLGAKVPCLQNFTSPHVGFRASQKLSGGRVCVANCLYWNWEAAKHAGILDGIFLFWNKLKYLSLLLQQGSEAAAA